MAAETSPSASDDLLKLAQVRFGTLSDAEAKLLRAAPQGEPAWCGPSQNEKDSGNDPSKADAKDTNWGPERSIRAKLVRWLCVDHDAKTRVDPKGLRIFAARIDGPLDLSFVAVPFPVSFWRCHLEDTNLMEVDIPSLYLIGSWVRGIGAAGARVKGNVFLRDGFYAEGEVRLLGAQIGGDLDCFGGTFKNTPKENVPNSGVALGADGIRVTGSVFFGDGFSAEGVVRMRNAQIGGILDCTGGTFKNPLRKEFAASGSALDAEGVRVTGAVLLRNGFSAEGEVVLVGAQIGGDLDCSGGAFSWLVVETAIIKGNFIWVQVHSPQLAALDLVNASVGSIADDESSWPDSGNLFIDGFVYGRISAGPTEPQKRLEWVELQKEFKAQPYRQLARVLSASGDEDGARYVLYQMEDRRQKKDRSYLLRWFLRVTVGHGYYPLRSLWGLGLLSGLGWIIYRRAHLAGAIAPTEEKAYQSFRTALSPPPHYERFVPLVYSVENSLPLVRLGQADKWQPDPNPQGVVLPTGKWKRRVLRVITSPRFLRGFLWVQIILGWILATMIAAGVSGILRRD